MCTKPLQGFIIIKIGECFTSTNFKVSDRTSEAEG